MIHYFICVFVSGTPAVPRERFATNIAYDISNRWQTCVCFHRLGIWKNKNKNKTKQNKKRKEKTNKQTKKSVAVFFSVYTLHL